MGASYLPVGNRIISPLSFFFQVFICSSQGVTRLQRAHPWFLLTYQTHPQAALPSQTCRHSHSLRSRGGRGQSHTSYCSQTGAAEESWWRQPAARWSGSLGSLWVGKGSPGGCWELKWRRSSVPWLSCTRGWQDVTNHCLLCGGFKAGGSPSHIGHTHLRDAGLFLIKKTGKFSKR